MQYLTKICQLNDIVPNTGRAALVDGNEVAIFRIASDGSDKIYALDNFCPFSKANVLSRGIIGCIDGKLVVASPIYKQRFDLETGQCLDDSSVALKTWQVTLDTDTIFLDQTKAAA